MTSPARLPSAVRRHIRFDAFAEAHRVVFAQVRVFFADADFVVPSLARVSSEARDGTPEHCRADRDYYDTAEFDLAADGVALRWDGQGQEWTAVLPAASVTGRPIRCEAGYPGTGESVPDPVHRLLHPYLHRLSIEKVARVSSRRLTRPLIGLVGIRLADVIDDDVVATRVDGEQRTHRSICVEVRDLDGPGRKVLADVSTLLIHSGCRTEAPMAELARAFGAPPRSP